MGYFCIGNLEEKQFCEVLYNNGKGTSLNNESDICHPQIGIVQYGSTNKMISKYFSKHEAELALNEIKERKNEITFIQLAQMPQQKGGLFRNGEFDVDKLEVYEMEFRLARKHKWYQTKKWLVKFENGEEKVIECGNDIYNALEKCVYIDSEIISITQLEDEYNE